MSYKNTVIVAYRNRIASLRVLLRSLFLASQRVKKDTYEIIITDLGYNSHSRAAEEEYKNKLNLKFLHPSYKGIFWKTKALNYAAKRSSGNYITMIDADSLVNCNFLEEIKSFFNHNKNDTKLAHRVRFVTPRISQTAIRRRTFDCNFISHVIIPRSSSFALARERYGRKEKKLKDIPKPNRKYYYDNKALGNGFYSMKKKTYMAIGGYDERFIGYGLEDLDFNLRAWRYLGSGTLKPDNDHTVFHIYHRKEADWSKEKCLENNRTVYRKNKKNCVVAVSMGENWGEF